MYFKTIIVHHARKIQSHKPYKPYGKQVHNEVSCASLAATAYTVFYTD
jgi:hypothetical protein